MTPSHKITHIFEMTEMTRYDLSTWIHRRTKVLCNEWCSRLITPIGIPSKWHTDSFNEYWDLEWIAGWWISRCYPQTCSRDGSAFEGTIPREFPERGPWAPSLEHFSVLSLFITGPLCHSVSCSVSQLSTFLHHPTDLLFSFLFFTFFFFLAYCFFCLPFILLSLGTRRHHHGSRILLLFHNKSTNCNNLHIIFRPQSQ